MEVIQTDKTDSISRRYQIIVLSILKNWRRRYSNHYIIKFIGFIPIYYFINLNIVSSYIIFNYLYLRSVIYYKLESIILFSFKKNKKTLKKIIT